MTKTPPLPHRHAKKTSIDATNAFLSATSTAQVPFNHVSPLVPTSPQARSRTSSRAVFSAMLNLCKSNDVSGLTLMLQSSPENVTILQAHKDDSGAGAVLIAVMNGHVEMTIMLLKSGCDPNVSNSYGWTPLALASYHGLIDIVTVILRGEGSSYRADLNATTAFGFTPLMCAIAQSHLDIAELLCTFGADVNFRETHGIGITALMLAAHCGNLHACTFLLESNAEVNAQCKLNGWTPLMFATAIRSLDIINLLLDRGSDPGIVNNSEETAMEIAICVEFAEGVSVLANALGIDEAAFYAALENADQSSLDISKTSSFGGTVSFGRLNGGKRNNSVVAHGSEVSPISAAQRHPQGALAPLVIGHRHRLSNTAPVPAIGAASVTSSSQSRSSPGSDSSEVRSPVTDRRPSGVSSSNHHMPVSVERRTSQNEDETERAFLAGGVTSLQGRSFVAGAPGGDGRDITGTQERTGLLSRIASKFIFRSPKQSKSPSISLDPHHGLSRPLSPASSFTVGFAGGSFESASSHTTPQGSMLISGVEGGSGSMLRRDSSLGTFGRLKAAGRPPAVYNEEPTIIRSRAIQTPSLGPSIGGIAIPSQSRHVSHGSSHFEPLSGTHGFKGSSNVEQHERRSSGHTADSFHTAIGSPPTRSGSLAIVRNELLPGSVPGSISAPGSAPSSAGVRRSPSLGSALANAVAPFNRPYEMHHAQSSHSRETTGGNGARDAVRGLHKADDSAFPLLPSLPHTPPLGTRPEQSPVRRLGSLAGPTPHAPEETATWDIGSHKPAHVNRAGRLPELGVAPSPRKAEVSVLLRGPDELNFKSRHRTVSESIMHRPQFDPGSLNLGSKPGSGGPRLTPTPPKAQRDSHSAGSEPVQFRRPKGPMLPMEQQL